MQSEPEDHGKKMMTWGTIAETRSSALIRILISWSSIFDKMAFWYSPTRCGWLGTILVSASSAMYLTRNDDQVNHAAIPLQTYGSGQDPAGRWLV